MKARAKGNTQSIASERAGFSERSARNVEKPEHMLKKSSLANKEGPLQRCLEN